ncbi:MAG: ABC transporter ATP-binding protein [Rubrivivax sp.]|nr:ABC transporter ATP-binding protein [Rubrivivax sp.]
MKPLLRTEALQLQVGARVLVDDLGLCVAPGQIWAVLGPNGSGKTTLLHTLAGLLPPAAGRIWLGERLLPAWPPGEAACMRGLLPQVLADAFSSPVLDVVLLGRHPHLGRWAWEAEADVACARAALAAVDLEGFDARDVLTLSGGERQRVGLAALLAQDPLLLLLDEPLAHLDLHHQVTVLQHLQALAAGGKAVLLALHDLNLAHRFATHALVLAPDGHHAGPVAQVMNAATLGAAYGHPLQRVQAAGHTLFVPA